MRKIIFGIVAVVSFSGAAAIGTKLAISDNTGLASGDFQELLEWEADSLMKDPYYGQKFIRTGPPDLLYNCHGWTFAGGTKSLTDAEVELIIQSGQYIKTPFPMSGDVVLYYDGFGNLCHSGIVKATGKDRFVLVESKWGGAGRFLHELKLPKTHTRYVFYRLKQGPMRPGGGPWGIPPTKKVKMRDLQAEPI